MARRPSGVKSSPSCLGMVILHENMSTECGRADCPGTGSIHAAANVRACGITGCERCHLVQGGASSRRLRHQRTATMKDLRPRDDFLREPTISINVRTYTAWSPLRKSPSAWTSTWKHTKRY